MGLVKRTKCTAQQSGLWRLSLKLSFPANSWKDFTGLLLYRNIAKPKQTDLGSSGRSYIVYVFFTLQICFFFISYFLLCIFVVVAVVKLCLYCNVILNLIFFFLWYFVFVLFLCYKIHILYKYFSSSFVT